MIGGIAVQYRDFIDEVARFATIFEPIETRHLVIDQLDLPTLVGGAIEHRDHLGVVLVVIDGEVETRRGIHPRLRDVQMSFPTFEPQPFFGELGHHADPFPIGIVLGTRGEGQRGKQKEGETEVLHDMILDVVRKGEEKVSIILHRHQFEPLIETVRITVGARCVTA